jgi:hypothetical protein
MLLLKLGDSIRTDGSEFLRNLFVFLFTWQKLLLLLLLLTAIELSLGGRSPYSSTDKIYTNKYKYMKQYKNTVQTIPNTVYTSTNITKTPTQLSQHPHIRRTS